MSNRKDKKDKFEVSRETSRRKFLKSSAAVVGGAFAAKVGLSPAAFAPCPRQCRARRRPVPV